MTDEKTEIVIYEPLTHKDASTRYVFHGLGLVLLLLSFAKKDITGGIMGALCVLFGFYPLKDRRKFFAVNGNLIYQYGFRGKIVIPLKEISEVSVSIHQDIMQVGAITMDQFYSIKMNSGKTIAIPRVMNPDREILFKNLVHGKFNFQD